VAVSVSSVKVAWLPEIKTTKDIASPQSGSGRVLLDIVQNLGGFPLCVARNDSKIDFLFSADMLAILCGDKI
jgi:cyanate permease